MLARLSLSLSARLSGSATATATAPAAAAAVAAGGQQHLGLGLIRNIGISAHVDSGKTTFSERVLFYTGKISSIHDIQGKDGVGCAMDHMELERERGITITSAATSVQWPFASSGETSETGQLVLDINLIDTPGHVDFQIEVERSLRVLDGAVMLVCGVNGVQSQTVTVDRQMRRYAVPRLIFVNKLDRRGSDVFKAAETLRKQFGNALPFVFMQLPIGQDHEFKGVVDLVRMRAVFFEGVHGERRVHGPIPEHMLVQAAEYRTRLVETVAELDDVVAEEFLMSSSTPNGSGDSVTAETLIAGIRGATLRLQLQPLFMGSAYKNKGVQEVLDAVGLYLPSPLDRSTEALNREDESETVSLSCETNKPLVAFAFKVQELPGQGCITYTRIYQGRVKKGDAVLDVRKNKRVTVRRILRLHASEAREIAVAGPGDIVGLTGLDVDSGTTLTDGRLDVTLQSMHVPEPVMSLAVRLAGGKAGDAGERFSKALGRFQREDPTFRVSTDAESKETVIAGMGELHLEVYAERMRREYGLEVVTGQPKVNFRETISARTDFNFTFKKQTGGRGLYGRVLGYMEPLEEGSADGGRGGVEFVNALQGNGIPPNFVPAIEKGFREASEEGLLTGHPVMNMRIVLEDGLAHEVDSNELAFKLAAKGAFDQAYEKAAPVVLEPVMKVQALCPVENQAAVLASLTGRRGCIISNAAVSQETQLVEASVPLRQMFGYTSEIRACTQGHGEFSMDFLEYAIMPGKNTDELATAYESRKKKRLALF